MENYYVTAFFFINYPDVAARIFSTRPGSQILRKSQRIQLPIGLPGAIPCRYNSCVEPSLPGTLLLLSKEGYHAISY